MVLRKRRLIAVVVLIAATVAIVASVAGILFLRSSGDTVAMPGTTSVGVPNGPATTKSIGPAGGSIASPDGRITVDVPPNAVPGPVNFSVQPITNLAHGGLGNAYRLEPSEQQFATPIKVSFKFDAQDLKDIIPEALAVAYQDKTGVWQAFKTINIDQAKKTLTVSTTHFTDWSVWTVELKPKKATLRVRGTQYIELVGCLEKLNLLTRLKTLLGRRPCTFLSPEEGSWSVDVGTITNVAPGAVVYQAPATRPSTGVATVRFVYKLRGSGETDIKDVRTCEITIVGRGYKASGESHDEVYSGVICDLEKPFDVNATGLANFVLKFVPSSPTEGKVSYATTYYPGGATAVESGSGSYSVLALGTPRARIAVTIDKATATATTMGHSVRVQPSMAGTVAINLTPADSECDRK